MTDGQTKSEERWGGGGGGYKLQALLYDIIPPWRKVPENEARSVGTKHCWIQR